MAYTASCLCNGIQLRINAELEPIMVCHCKQCQKAQGAAFAAITQVQKRFRLYRVKIFCKRILHRLIKKECSVKPAVHLSGVNV